jgi:ketosteroid isomerase-like protein
MFLPFLDEDVQWSWPLTPESFRGRHGVLRAATDWLEAVDNWQIELEEVVDAGDRVFSQRVRAVGKGSGVPSAQQVYSVITFRGGRILRIEDHLDRGAALEAAGLSQ